MNVIRHLSLCTGLLGLALAGFTAPLHAQNPWSAVWEPPVAAPLYPPEKGPVVVVDEAHFNFHTINGRYHDFARVLERDGYVVRPGKMPFSSTAMQGTQILVIANALSEWNRDQVNWSPPISSAFSAEEINAVQEWVLGGGSLLLIADHLPFAGATEKLAAAFGFEVINGYALDRREIHKATLDRPFVFARHGNSSSDGTLADHAITHGRNSSERVDRVMTFMGAAFRARGPAAPLLVFGKEINSYQTETFGKISAATPSVAASGLMQGAARHYGKGRVVFFSEAGLFGVQWQGGKPVGMNHPGASGNLQLLLNTMHWLNGALESLRMDQRTTSRANSVPEAIVTGAALAAIGAAADHQVPAR